MTDAATARREADRLRASFPRAVAIMLAEARMAREAAEQAMREAEEARKADDGLVTQDAYVHIVSTRKRVRDYECDGCTSLVVSGRPVLTSGGKHVTGSHDLIGEKMAKRAAEAKFQRAMVECFPDFGRWLASGNFSNEVQRYMIHRKNPTECRVTLCAGRPSTPTTRTWSTR
jgi:hypothetical protein